MRQGPAPHDSRGEWSDQVGQDSFLTRGKVLSLRATPVPVRPPVPVRSFGIVPTSDATHSGHELFSARRSDAQRGRRQASTPTLQ